MNEAAKAPKKPHALRPGILILIVLSALRVLDDDLNLLHCGVPIR